MGVVKKEAIVAKQVQSSIESTDTVTPARKGERDTDRLRTLEASIAELEARRQDIGLVGQGVEITDHETYAGFKGDVVWADFDKFRPGVEIALVALHTDRDGDEILKAPTAKYGLSARVEIGQLKTITVPDEVLNLDLMIASKTEKLARLIDAS